MISISAFQLRTHRIATATLAVAFVLGYSLTAAAQSTTPAGSPAGVIAGGRDGMHAAVAPTPAQKPVLESATAVAKEENGQKPADGLNQGMKVHGHWTIDIKNADGTLAHHHEFENALQYDGQQLLTGLLSGYAVMGGWEIYFTAQTGGTSPCTGAAYPFCAITESTTALPGSFACSIYTCVGGLTVTPTFGVGPSIKLTGSMAAPQAGTIGSVGTGYSACNKATGDATGSPTSLATANPAGCVSATTGVLGGTGTYANLTPIPVASGQIIQISVVLTFS